MNILYRQKFENTGNKKMSAKIAPFYKLHGNVGKIENFAEIIGEIRVANKRSIHTGYKEIIYD